MTPAASSMRRLPLRTLVLVAAALSAAAPPAAGTFVMDAASYSAGDVWIVSGDESLVDRHLTHAGKIVIRSGGVLEIRDSTLVLDNSAYPCGYMMGRICVPDILVEPGGTLIVASSRIEGASSAPIGHAFLLVHGRVESTDSEFVRTSGLIVSTETASALVEQSTFADGSGGVSIIRGASGLVRGNAFEGVGIVVTDAAADVVDNHVRNATIGLRVATTIVGAHCCRALPDVTGNTFEDVDVGVHADSIEAFSIGANRVLRAEVGVRVVAMRVPEVPAEGVPSVDGNVFVDVATAIEVRNAGSHVGGETLARGPLTVHAHLNDFAGACTAVRVLDDPGMPLAADATRNWWGSAAGPTDAPGCPATVGDVTTSPWLTGYPVA